MSGPGNNSLDHDKLKSQKQLPNRQLALLVAALIVGAAVGLLFLDQVFTRIPTDIQRLGKLSETLRAQRSTPEIVVFGNSVVMSGIDTRGLSEAIPGRPLAWNFSSTGQALVEAYLLTQDLPQNVGVVIYSLFAHATPSAETLHSQKYNTLFMYGYRASQDTTSAIREIYGPAVGELLGESSLSQIFESRWAIRQLIDTQSRRMIRSDLALRESVEELFHPQKYTDPINPGETARRIAQRSNEYANAKISVPPAAIQLAQRISQDAKKNNRRTVFLFPPVHPDLFAPYQSEINAAVGVFRKALVAETNTQIIVAMDILGRDHFIDDNHPTNAGAKILTEYVAAALNMSQ